MNAQAFQSAGPHDTLRAAVKEPFKLPFVFLFIILCVTAVLSALSVLSAWGALDAGRPFTFSYFLHRLPRAAFDSLVPSVVLSIVLAGFRMARRQFSRFLGFLIVLVVGYLAMVNGMLWLSALAGKEKPLAAAQPRYLQPLTFLKVDGVEVAPASAAGGKLAGVLLYDPAGAPQRLSVFAAGEAVAADGALAVNLAGPGGRRITGVPESPASGVFAQDAVTAFVLRGIGTLTADLERLMRSALPQFFAASFALVFVCAASLVILRLTRWPLANVVLLMCAVGGYFSLYHVLLTRASKSVAAAVTDPALVDLFPSAAFVALGVILLLVDILFVPADRWAHRSAPT